MSMIKLVENLEFFHEESSKKALSKETRSDFISELTTDNQQTDRKSNTQKQNERKNKSTSKYKNGGYFGSSENQVSVVCLSVRRITWEKSDRLRMTIWRNIVALHHIVHSIRKVVSAYTIFTHTHTSYTREIRHSTHCDRFMCVCELIRLYVRRNDVTKVTWLLS